MNAIKINRNPDETLAENCKENIGVKIGSFDCTANCKYNQNTTAEIHEQAFNLEFVRCKKITPANQLQIEL